MSPGFQVVFAGTQRGLCSWELLPGCTRSHKPARIKQNHEAFGDSPATGKKRKRNVTSDTFTQTLSFLHLSKLGHSHPKPHMVGSRMVSALGWYKGQTEPEVRADRVGLLGSSDPPPKKKALHWHGISLLAFCFLRVTGSRAQAPS